MGFSRQEYWSRCPFPSPGDLPDSGIEPTCPVWDLDFFFFFTTDYTLRMSVESLRGNEAGLGPFAGVLQFLHLDTTAIFASGHTSPPATKYKETIWN